MKVKLLICLGVLYLATSVFQSCSKGKSETPVVTPPPADTTTTTPPKDTTVNPPKDTVTTPPKDTTTTPPKDTVTNTLAYRTMIVPSGLVIFLDSTTSGRTFIDYQDGIFNHAKLDNYLPEFEKAQLSSDNEGDINVKPDPNTPGDQLVTFSSMSPLAAYKDLAPVSDTAKYYNLRVRQGNLVTVIFPNQASVIRYRNLNHTVTLADVKAANNQTIYVEHLYYGTY